VTSPHALDRVAHLLDVHIGLKSDPSFRRRLTRTLRDLEASRNVDAEQLIGALAKDPTLLDELLDRVTVQETGFFRHPDQFDTVARDILPGIGGPLRAWSAAAANGQEAYSLAMLFEEAGRPGSVLASDISPAALRRVAGARYAEREMGNVSAERRRRHFTATADGWQAGPALRDMVVVERHNLIDPIPARVGECQVVMCRNVLIYLSEDHARLFLDRLAEVMDPAALLFVGGAETLWQITDRFEPVQMGSCYAYRPRPEGRAHAAGSGPGATRPETPPLVETRPAVVPTPPRTPSSTPGPIRPVPAPATPDRTPASRPSVVVGDVGAGPDETGPAQERLGRRLLAEGSVEAAIVAFRRWSYHCPDNPLAHFQLGAALDQAHGGTTGRRAYRAALGALDRCGGAELAVLLKGYDRTELRKLLVARSAGPDAAAPAPAGPRP
jgi:chemotaxis protein methyltransferase CheR